MIFVVLFFMCVHTLAYMLEGTFAVSNMTTSTNVASFATTLQHIATFQYGWLEGNLAVLRTFFIVAQCGFLAVAVWEGVSTLFGGIFRGGT